MSTPSRRASDWTSPVPASRCLCDAKIGGKVEVDFQGQFVTRNKPGLLLRHAYVEAKNDDYRLLVGQTWDVISPLGIPTLNYTAGSAVGNLAYRRAQFRGGAILGRSPTRSCMTLQGSVNGNVVTDFVSDPATTTSADPGPYPDVQGRVGFTLGERSGPDVEARSSWASAAITASRASTFAPRRSIWASMFPPIRSPPTSWSPSPDAWEFRASSSRATT